MYSKQSLSLAECQCIFYNIVGVGDPWKKICYNLSLIILNLRIKLIFSCHKTSGKKKLLKKGTGKSTVISFQSNSNLKSLYQHPLGKFSVDSEDSAEQYEHADNRREITKQTSFKSFWFTLNTFLKVQNIFLTFLGHSHKYQLVKCYSFLTKVQIL